MTTWTLCTNCSGTGHIDLDRGFGQFDVDVCPVCNGTTLVSTRSGVPALCEDEGCPHFGTPHVCIEKDPS